MTAKNLNISQVSFNSKGLVDCFSASIEKNGRILPLAIYVHRSGKLIEFKIESSEQVDITDKLYSKLLRRVEAFDKEGKRSLKL